MLRHACLLLLFLVVSLAATAAEGELAAGIGAYERGDYAAALGHWLPLAEQGSPQAQFNVGLLHAKGRGVAQDATEAARWYRLAAEQGLAQAQYNLAALYEQGRGVPRDPLLSYAWFRLAAQQKFADARKRRKRAAKRLTPHEIAQGDLMVREWLRAREEGGAGDAARVEE
jgi:TPR repeat protein